jgi:hypothetical protein
VNQPMIRHWAAGLEDRNPVYTDPAFAAESRFGGIVAPPLSTMIPQPRAAAGRRARDAGLRAPAHATRPGRGSHGGRGSLRIMRSSRRRPGRKRMTRGPSASFQKTAAVGFRNRQEGRHRARSRALAPARYRPRPRARRAAAPRAFSSERVKIQPNVSIVEAAGVAVRGARQDVHLPVPVHVVHRQGEPQVVAVELVGEVA